MSEFFDGHNWEKRVNGWTCTATAVPGGFLAEMTYYPGVTLPNIAKRVGHAPDHSYQVHGTAHKQFEHADAAMEFICGYAEAHGAAVLELMDSDDWPANKRLDDVRFTIPITSRLTTVTTMTV